MNHQLIERTVRSADGTKIGFVQLGTGPAVLFVHGSLSTGDDWLRVATLMSKQFTCYLIDRRGRGRSGDAADYTLERECEDISAVFDVAGPGTYLLGHSYGATCSLVAALRLPLERLVLYEPPLALRGSITQSAIEPYRAAIAANQLDEALTIGLTHFARMPADKVTSFRRTRFWSKQAALTPTWTREVEAIYRLGPNLEQYKNLSTPTLLLTGTKSVPYPLQEATAALSRILPFVHVAQLHGQGHAAHLANPRLLVDEVVNFLKTKL